MVRNFGRITARLINEHTFLASAKVRGCHWDGQRGENRCKATHVERVAR